MYLYCKIKSVWETALIYLCFILQLCSTMRNTVRTYLMELIAELIVRMLLQLLFLIICNILFKRTLGEISHWSQYNKWVSPKNWWLLSNAYSMTIQIFLVLKTFIPFLQKYRNGWNNYEIIPLSTKEANLSLFGQGFPGSWVSREWDRKRSMDSMWACSLAYGLLALGVGHGWKSSR